MAERTVATFSNELDFNRISGLLESKKVPHQKRAFQYNPYPIPNQSFGEITVPGVHREALMEALSNDKDGENLVVVETIREQAHPVAKGKWRSRLFFVVIVLGMLIAMGLAFKYKQQVDASNTSKHFMYEWSFDNSILYMRDSVRGFVATKWWDENYDYNYEKCESRDLMGNITLTIDEDENGYWDHTQIFNAQRKLTAESHDHDRDGYFEYSAIYLESGDTLMLNDVNKNGIQEMEIRPFKQ